MRVLALVTATLGLGLSLAQDIGHIDAYVRSQMDAAQVQGLALGVVQDDRVLHLRGFGAADDSGRAEPSTMPEEVVRSLAKVRPTALPGRSFQYSDANYMTLGVLVEAVSGQPYAHYVQRHILAPLDMTNTFLSGEQALQHSVAVGHGTVAGRPEAAPPGYFCPGYLGASFIVSTAQDMTHWLIAHLNQGRYGSRSVLSAAGIAELHWPGVPTGSLFGPGSGYGMGWVVGTSLGAPVIAHGGDDSYFHSDVRMAPQQYLGVVVLMNASAVNSPYALARASIAPVVLASLVEANTPFGLGVPALLALILITQAALALRMVVVLRRAARGRSGNS